jgi:hypothetical protein
LDDLCNGLEHLDKLRGLPYGGAAITAKTPPKIPQKNPTSTPLGIVTAVHDPDTKNHDGLEMHKDAWVGAINLPKDRVKLLRQMFKCAQCRSNGHTLPSCPLMKHWIIKRKPRPDGNGDSDASSTPSGGVNSVIAPTHNEQIIHDKPTENIGLHPIPEEQSDSNDDTFAPVEFDLLEATNSLDVMTINGHVTPYTDLNIPLGSVHSVYSSQVTQDHTQSFNPSSLDVIIVKLLLHTNLLHSHM